MLILTFSLCSIALAYIYVGFPLLVLLRGTLFSKPYQTRPFTPSVSVLIAAYNEEDCILARIENLLALDYPTYMLEVLIASDGSDDRTCEIVSNLDSPHVKLLELSRAGKGAALNAAAAAANGDVLVFSDANTHFAVNALRELVQPFVDAQVGGVAGNQIYTKSYHVGAAADGEQAYWNFDRWLKQAQSASGNVTSATGAIYAIRRWLFQPVPQFVMDDFFISTGVPAQGYRLVFASKAIALESVAADAHVEFQRKIRVAQQGLAGVRLRSQLLNPLRHGWYAWQLLSHKVLRRMAIFPLLGLFTTNLLLLDRSVWFQMAIALQGLFYVLALQQFPARCL